MNSRYEAKEVFSRKGSSAANRELPPPQYSPKVNAYHSLMRTICRIVPGSGLQVRSIGCGFFADVFATLNGMRFARKNGIPAAIFWTKESLYFDRSDGSEVWSKHFCSEVSLTPGISFPFRPSPFVTDGRTVPGHFQEIQELIMVFCKPQKHFVLAAEEICPFHDGPVLGLHFRGTDQLAGHEGRKIARLEDYSVHVEEALSSGVKKIFVATDDAHAIDELQNRFGKIYFQDCVRSQDGFSIHGHYDKGQAVGGSEKARQVLIDAICLSKCDMLIHGGSSVAAFAIGLNPEMKSQDLRWMDSL